MGESPSKPSRILRSFCRSGDTSVDQGYRVHRSAVAGIGISLLYEHVGQSEGSQGISSKKSCTAPRSSSLENMRKMSLSHMIVRMLSLAMAQAK